MYLHFTKRKGIAIADNSQYLLSSVIEIYCGSNKRDDTAARPSCLARGKYI